MNKKTKFGIFVAFLLVSIFIAFFPDYLFNLLESVLNYYSYSHFFGALIFILIFIGLTTFAFSVSLLVVAGAFFFGFWEILIYAMIGIIGSSSIVFYISKRLGRDYARDYFKKRGTLLCDIDGIIEKNTFRTITVLSTVFFVPPMIPNLLGGIIKISYKKYLLATFIGNLPTTFFTVLIVVGAVMLDEVYVISGIIGVVMVSLIALYFYKGEIQCLLRLSFPWAFRRK
ncbi:MAG: VTT domain-containing protein [Nanoarchaeota archaeon]|nr:VTT domain-containing protein [Nanoarchaeota archaeon]